MHDSHGKVVSLQNPLYVISSETVRLLIRAVSLLETEIVFEEVGETQLIELQNFTSVLEAELQHRELDVMQESCDVLLRGP